MKILSYGFLIVLAGLVNYVESGTESCKFGDETEIHNSEKVIGGCRKFKCADGKWEPLPMSAVTVAECDLCTAHDDVHMKTFDEKYYDFPVTRCPFVLVQKTTYPVQIPFGHPTEYGVRARFRKCGFHTKPNHPISCNRAATLKSGALRVHFVRKVVSPDVFVGFEVHGIGPVVYVNTMTVGEVTPVPSASDARILVWSEAGIDPINPCLYAVSKELMVLWCPHSLTIWRKKNIAEPVGGLCGNQDGDKTNEYIDKDGIPQELKPFAKSWKIGDDYCTLGDWRFELNYLKDCATTAQADYRTKCKEIRDKNSPLIGTTPGNHFVQGCVSEHCAININHLHRKQHKRLYRIEERVAKVTSELLDFF